MENIESLLSKVLEESSTAVFIVDASTMKFVYANKTAAQELGYSQEEMLSIGTNDISTHAKTKEALLALFNTPENKHKDIPECILSSFHKPKHGPAFPVELRLQLSTYNARQAFVAFVQKMSSKQKKLVQLDKVTKSVSIGYWDRNLQTDSYDISNRCLEILGFNPENLENPVNEWLSRIHHDDIEVEKNAIAKCIKDGLPYVIEFRVKHKGGHYVWIQESGSIIERDPISNEPQRIYGTILDISKRKNNDLEKFKVHEKFHALAENSEDLIIQFDREFRHLYVNPAILKFRRLQPHEYIGKTHKEIGFPDHLCEFWGKSN